MWVRESRALLLKSASVCRHQLQTRSHTVPTWTSSDGVQWERRGILVPPVSGKPMSETMSARVYGSELVIMITPTLVGS